MDFPNTFVPSEVFEIMPKDLFFSGYFAAYLTRVELQSLCDQCGEIICQPEPQIGIGDSRDLRRVMVIDNLTGNQVAEIMQKHVNWFVFLERARYSLA